MPGIHRGIHLSLATLLAVAAAAPALATFSAAGIEIDGNYTDDVMPGDDWFPDFPPATDKFGSADDTLCGTSPAPKNDITNYFLTSNQDFLYVGLERLANTGQTSFFLSFDITGDGPSKGDFIFVFCFGSGSTVTDTYVLEWDETRGEFVRDSTPATIDFRVNTLRIPAPFRAFDRHGAPQPFIDAGKFAESSIDLSSIEGFDVCDAASVTAELQTKSSCSLNSECKDTTGPFVFSFQPLDSDLVLEQEDACVPLIRATARATGPRPPFHYRWFLDGNEILDPAFDTDRVEIAVPPGQCATHEVKVLVSDATCEIEDRQTIDLNFPPAAAFAGVAVGDCDLTLRYDGTASSDCDGDPLTFAWDFDGDGIADSSAASGAFAYPGCGERKVTLQVSDGKCESPAVETRVYANQPPVAGLAMAADDCLSLSFADTSVDCDLGQSSPLYTEKLARSIDFGDGSPVSTDPAGTHAFPDCGDYTVTLTETDAMGCRSVATRKVTLTMSVLVQ